MESLKFSRCQGVWSNNLKNMLLNNPSLKVLTFSILEDFCDDLLFFIGATCKQLEFLSIGGGFNFTHLLEFAEAHSEAAGASSIVKLYAPSKNDSYLFLFCELILSEHFSWTDKFNGSSRL